MIRATTAGSLIAATVLLLAPSARGHSRSGRYREAVFGTSQTASESSGIQARATSETWATQALSLTSAIPGGSAAGAAAGAANGFTFWNALAAIPTVRINFVAGAAAAANVPLTWAALAAGIGGETGNPAVNFMSRPITLNQAVTLRSDGWNLVSPAVLQVDAFTINVHEAGHALGLDHPASVTQIMSQTVASTGPGGRWTAVVEDDSVCRPAHGAECGRRP